MEFLPNDYISPTGNSGYMRIQEGENKIRILSSPILGWEDWMNKKPIRFRMNAKPTAPVNPAQPIRHFWAFIVWDYAEKGIKIFEIVQATIRKKIEALSKDSDWGAPYFYDLKIIKSGKATDTEYAVNPLPSSRELDPVIRQAFLDKPINLEEMYSGQDPFSSLKGRTLGFWEKAAKSEVEPVIEEDTIDMQQLARIEDEVVKFIDPVDKEWRSAAYKAFKVTAFAGLKKSKYDSMMRQIETKKKSLKDAELEEVPF